MEVISRQLTSMTIDFQHNKQQCSSRARGRSSSTLRIYDCSLLPGNELLMSTVRKTSVSTVCINILLQSLTEAKYENILLVNLLASLSNMANKLHSMQRRRRRRRPRQRQRQTQSNPIQLQPIKPNSLELESATGRGNKKASFSVASASSAAPAWVVPDAGSCRSRRVGQHYIPQTTSKNTPDRDLFRQRHHHQHFHIIIVSSLSLLQL